ncbi:hypothetical protein ACFVYE_37005 [Streptomyces sp. NPDC058239]|uniref:hypothetical protein n=1 Tax=Streptomyces sp. NPDC058239 TaxID=3346395 RepID=UPI0036E907A1
MRVLRIDPDTMLTEVVLSERDAHFAIREHVGTTGAVDQAVYHSRVLLHLHGEGQVIGLGQNLAAWALASAWRGMPLYPLHGPVVLTGRTGGGGVAALDDGLVQHARTVTRTVRETLVAWRMRPPASNDAAVSELLAYAARDIAARR